MRSKKVKDRREGVIHALRILQELRTDVVAPMNSLPLCAHRKELSTNSPPLLAHRRPLTSNLSRSLRAAPRHLTCIDGIHDTTGMIISRSRGCSTE